MLVFSDHRLKKVNPTYRKVLKLKCPTAGQNDDTFFGISLTKGKSSVVIHGQTRTLGVFYFSHPVSLTLFLSQLM